MKIALKSFPAIHVDIHRAVADQLYGDQEMHPCVRAQCMDYIQVRNTLPVYSSQLLFLSTRFIMY